MSGTAPDFSPYMPGIAMSEPGSIFNEQVQVYGIRLGWIPSHTCGCSYAGATPGSPNPRCKTCFGRGIYWSSQPLLFSGLITYMHTSSAPDEPGQKIDPTFGALTRAEPTLTIPNNGPNNENAVWNQATRFDAYVELDAPFRVNSTLIQGQNGALPYQLNSTIVSVTAYDPVAMVNNPVAQSDYTYANGVVTLSDKYPEGTAYVVEYDTLPVYIGERHAGGLVHDRPFGNMTGSLPRRFRLVSLDLWTRARSAGDGPFAYEPPAPSPTPTPPTPPSTTNPVSTTPAIAFTPVAGLNNGMATQGAALTLTSGPDPASLPVPVVTAVASGLTNPTWTLAVQNDECQFLCTLEKDPALPRYVLVNNPDGSVTVNANYLSAQTDELVLTATAGSLSAQVVIPIVVSGVSGPTVTVMPGSVATGSSFPSWNAALDASWGPGGTYAGMTLEMPGGVYPNTLSDFTRTVIGHGSNQQWPPGPMTLTGPSAANRTILDFNYTAPGTGQGAMMIQGGDLTYRFLLLRNVSNIIGGAGNAGAFYKTNEQPYNVTIDSCIVYNCDDGFLGGDEGQHITITNSVFGQCGNGEGGLTHNAYVGHASYLTVTNVLSFSTAQVHEFKSRSRRGSYTNSSFIDGLNGCPGASSCVDLPIGGEHVLTGCVFHKGPNPNNDGNMVQFCAEIIANGPGWDTNSLVIDGCTFINTCAPGAITSQVYGLVLFDNGSGGPAVSPTTGLPAGAIVRNCKFYNIPRANWWKALNAGNTIVDGGGNVDITTWPFDLLPIDPATGQTLAIAPPPSYAIPTAHLNEGIMAPSLMLQIRVGATAAAGTALVSLAAYDTSGSHLTNAAWSLLNNDGGRVTIDQQGNVVTAQANIIDSLRFFEVKVTGKDYSGTAKTYTKFLFYVVGQGTVAAS